MIKELKKKFVVTAIAAVFALLVVILTLVNVVNFSLVARDADMILDRLSGQNGRFPEQSAPAEQPTAGDGQMGPRGPMGPDSPETGMSTRYFTYSFDADGTATQVEFRMAAQSESQAEQWARSLLGGARGGWTRSTYRYRLYVVEDKTYVTVIDQGREMLPSYRVLWASVIGTVAGTVASLIALVALSGKFVKPLEQSDAKQKKFIADAARELKTPLTVLDFDSAEIKRQHGESRATRSMNKQLVKMNGVADKLDSLLLQRVEKMEKKDVDLAVVAASVAREYDEVFSQAGVAFEKSFAAAVCRGNEETLRKLIAEALDNATKFAVSRAKISVEKQGERVVMEFRNDCKGMAEGSADTVFERFWKEDESQGSGLGLAIVKEVANLHEGRALAKVENGEFVLKVEL